MPSGVPQVSILSPLLFTLYVNDPTICPDVNIQMYADITSSASQIACNIYKLIKAMQYITMWLKQSCVQLNVSKIV